MSPTMPLQPGSVVPTFTLPTPDGTQISRSEYRGKAALLLLFLPVAEPAMTIYLEELDAAMRSWPREQTALVIAPPDSDDVPDSVHYRVLLDSENTVHQQFLPQDTPGGWFITDRYGELFAQGAAQSTADLPQPEEFTDWLEHVGMRCSG